MPSTRATGSGKRGASRGAPMLRLRIGFVLIAMVLSFFGARLVQLQGVDPRSYAVRAAAEGAARVPLEAERGDILDRNGVPLADSVKGKMVVANPVLTADRAPELARLLSERLSVDYFKTLTALRGRKEGSQFEYIARRVPSTLAGDTLTEVDAAGFEGISLRDDPIRSYPSGDVAANLLGYMGTDEPLGGFERTFDEQLAGVDGEATWQSTSGKSVRIPLRESTLKAAKNGAPLRTTIDRDLQWFTQKVLAQSVRQYRAVSGAAIVMDTRTGEILALADVPTFDANAPTEAKSEDDLGSRAMSDTYEPGSVEKVLTAAALIDAGKAFPRQRFKVPPNLARQDRVIGDWFDHGNIRLTLAGIIAKSSNIGTVLAADAFSPVELVGYLQRFGLGQRTDIGVRGETPGILTPGEAMTSQTKDRVAFGQSLSVNVAQMAAAVNTIANGGVRVSPSLIAGSAVTDDGVTVGTDVATRTRVVSKQAARATARMMEKVVDPEDGVAPAAQVPGYLVAGKTGTAQRVASDGTGYDGSTSVSFGGFAPADDARFTVYVVVHAPKVDGGGGSIAGPVFSRIMGYVLGRYGVEPTNGTPSRLPVEW
ncbi:peptidoglycan D,D-transpeptidase FtsI family protein [Nocardioides pinisoli]|uniref:Penicillin-binding protein 2 n=1 Tax=Nocardioides pinisoli TaxID=2950279 RepID=A0ABT1KU02_9ACTN|nr:penicillin-binding protein 2 [Nocardioides pinisoli]MCP3421219.1 penicillin-binding protein 2 [Nocardioides pinisoli]